MKSFTRFSLAFALIVVAVAVTFATFAGFKPALADDLSGGIQAPAVAPVVVVNPAPVVNAEPIAPEGQTKLPTFKKTDKGLLIGQVFGKYGTVYLYDNGKGYRWSEITEKSTVIVYGPGQQRREIVVELDEPAPVTVTTTRWGKVYTDPRLVAGWIDGE